MMCGLYEHYKGGYYQVLGIAEHTETREIVVVYVSLDATLSGPRMRVRPAHGPNGFFSKVNPTRNSERPRFLYVGDGV
jgi:hypothetical protein